MSERIFHTLGPVVFKEARVLILGSMPSPKSRETGFYYGHPGNRFWKIMEALFDTTLSNVEEKKKFLIRERIAMWDVLQSCDISGASDASIKNPVANDIGGIVKGTDIIAIFTTGKTAHDLLVKLLNIDSVCLPSPSPANCAVSLDVLIERYSVIKHYLCQT